MDRYIVFTDYDIDGAGSYLAFKWLSGIKDAEVIPLKVSNLREKLLSWLNKNSLENYKKVFFFDLDTSAVGDLIDKPNVEIYDHHETHVYDYKHASACIQVTTSCAKLIYNKYKSDVKLTVPQITLLSLVDDYDSYTLAQKHSYDLNILFWYYNSDRVSFFCERFANGFDGFTSQEKNLIKSYIRKFNKFYKELRLYTADIEIKDKSYKFISSFADKYVNDVAHNILEEHKDCNIVMLINTGNKRVYFRKQKDTDIHLGKLAEKICKGGGHEYAAGGELSESIKVLSRDFQPLL